MRRALALLLTAAALLVAAPAAADEPDERPEPAPVAPYILGGSLATPGSWPGVVALAVQRNGGLFQFCGGTLIRADLVLTAAHCTVDLAPSEIQVIVGRTDLSQSGGEIIPASSIVQHPGWSELVSRDDISVIRLSRPTTAATVRFLTPATEPNWATSPLGTLLGWGATDPAGDVPSAQLKQLSVAVLSDEHCSSRVQTYWAGGDLCVESPTFGACHGDSGGPFMASVGGATQLAGVISRGPADPCGRGPAIVTRVAAYAEWIYRSTLSPGTTRLSGADRYATAAALSARFEPGVPVVYLVTGERFPDAVTAAAVAGRAGGPVLLTTRDELPAATRAELGRLRPGRLVVVGGTGAISDAVVARAQEWAGVPAERIAGTDRYATAAALAADAYGAGAPIVYLTVGTAFPDAVASGPVAGGPGAGPVLLTETGTLPAPTRDRLAALAPGRVVILGGHAAVAPAVEAQVASLLPGVTIERVAGADRFATSAALSRSAFSPGVPVVYIATGLAFPDALASGPLAVRSGAPVLLVDGARVPQAVADEIRRLDPERIEVLGGTSAVPTHTMWLLDGLS